MFRKLLLILAFVTSLSGYSQRIQSNDYNNSDSRSIGETLNTDFGHTWKGIARFYTSPLRWKKKDYQTLGIVLGSYAALSLADRSLRKEFLKVEDKAPQPIKEFGFRFGGPINAVIFSSGLYTYGLLAKKSKIKKTGILMMSSIAAAGFLQTSIKTVVGRARPRAGGPYTFKPFSASPGFHSFPSGHSVVSMVFIHSIARQVENPWAKVGLYTVGAISPISRLWTESHWFSDVALGSFLGILTVDYIDNYLTQIYEGKKATKLTNTWKFQPGLNNMKLSYTFN
ncbi:phosphatase PAP2 family protein [Wenyingzhuangia sp. IMCC45533]